MKLSYLLIAIVFTYLDEQTLDGQDFLFEYLFTSVLVRFQQLRGACFWYYLMFLKLRKLTKEHSLAKIVYLFCVSYCGATMTTEFLSWG